MKKLTSLFVLIGFPLFLLSPVIGAQEEVENQAEPGWQNVAVPFNYQNLQVPSELWETIKTILRKDGASEKIIETFSVAPISIQVELQSDNPSVLSHALNYRFLYIEGGGDLDLFNYVSGKGDLFLRFSPHLNDGYDYHILYLSDSPGKEVGRSIWGNGCGKIFDLSDSASRFIEDKGVKLTSSRRQYMHLMAGTFIFFQLVEERLFLGYIRVLDSRYPNFSCKAI